MSLFVHYDNQTILWNTIQQHPNIQNIPKNEQSSWFKYHIQTMYEKIPTARFQTLISTEELNELNKNTIRQMIQDLQPQNQRKEISSTSLDSLHTTLDSSITLDRNDTSTTFTASSPNAAVLRTFASGSNITQYPINTIRRDQTNSTSNIHDRFKEKQQEMESLLQVQPPSKVEFKISEIDEPITNMEELIQQQLRQRELDMMPKMLPDASPPNLRFSGTSSLSASLPPAIQSTEKPMGILKHDLVVGDVLSTEQLNVFDLDISAAPISVSKKRITFSDENPQTPPIEGSKIIFDYVSRLDQLESRLDSLEGILNQHDERIKMLEFIGTIGTQVPVKPPR